MNTLFRCCEFSSQTLSTAQRILHRALAASRAKNGPSPVSKGAISFCSRAARLLFLVSDCQAAALESLWSHYIFQKVTLPAMYGCIDRRVIAHCHVHSAKLCPPKLGKAECARALTCPAALPVCSPRDGSTCNLLYQRPLLAGRPAD